MKKLLVGLLSLVLAAGVVRAAEPVQGVAEMGQPVRNVIYLIGDGMGLAHVSMLQIEGDYAPTSFDRAQGVALIGTRSLNNRVTDSAAAGTALATGHKTNNGVLGQDPEGREFVSMMTLAGRQGMPTGIAVTCYLQHATPAAFYTHVANRNETEAITRDLCESGVDVLFGGGRKWLAGEVDGGKSGYDLFRGKGYTVVETLEEAEGVQSGPLLAVVADAALPGAAERGDYLPRATRKALELLSSEADRRGKGFLLMVEGSQIDWAGHANNMRDLLAEMRDFDRTVAAAMDFADRTPGTLVIVTADHETGGLTVSSNKEDFTLSESGLHYGFGTGSHTATMVPVYLYGAGADRITGVMDNTELARRIMQLLQLAE